MDSAFVVIGDFVKKKIHRHSLLILALVAKPTLAQQVIPPGSAMGQERTGVQAGSADRPELAVTQPVSPVAPIEAAHAPLRVPTPPDEEGIDTGAGFKLYPDINVGATYDSNVFATRANETADWSYSVTPSLLLRKETDTYKLDVRAGLEAVRYRDNSNQNTNDHWLEGQAVYQLTSATNVYGGLGHTRSHEDRSTPDQRFGTVPTVYHDDNAFAGMFHDFGPAYIRLGVVHSRLAFEDVPTSTPGVNLINRTRNRSVTSYGGRLGYRATPNTDVFLQATSEDRSYHHEPDAGGYYRTSSGSRIAVGSAFNFSDKLVGEAYVGQLRQDYDDVRLRDVRAAEFGASLRWHSSPWTTYRFSLDRSLEETVLPGASGYLSTTAGLRVEHDLSENTLFTTGLFLGRNAFQGIDRTDRTAEFSVGIRHYISPTVYLSADYTAYRRSSDVIDAMYSRSLMSFLIGTDFGARRRSRYFAYEERKDMDFNSDQDGFSGPYVGVGLAHGSLNSRAEGLRDATPGNTDIGHFGNEADGANLVLGYGHAFNRAWYLGLEAELERGDGTLSHLHPSSTEPLNFSVRLKDGAGLSLRLGYVLPSGNLFYGRVGRVRSHFVNTMQNIDGSFERTFTQSGTRLGIGAEVPAGRNLFLRMDYAYTKYSSYNFATTSYDERYLNKSGMVTVGMGWRFGGPQPSTEAIDPTFIRGAYAGGQIAHGAVNSHLNAPVHYHASGNDSLLADFGKLETSSSAYLGYGQLFNRWYLGVEAELDPSLTRWSHDRTTSGSGGRDFAVSKKGNHGLDLRAGYVLDNGSLLYVRLGASRAKFNTTYTRGSNAVDRVDTLTGTRLGFGVEMPINKASFIRLDYLMTDHGSIPSFAAGGTGTSDLINISTKEGQFRVGFGIRF